ncbi:MAG: head GIN domain-containing protein [Myxococcota bacterium]
MRRLILGMLGVAVASLATGCIYIEEEVGSGYPRTVTKELPPYDKISVRGALGDVDIRTCDECERIRVTADDNLIDNIHAEVDDDTLELHVDGSIAPVTPIEIVVRTTVLREVEVRGASDVVVQGELFDELELDISGASMVDVSGRVAELEAELSGSSTLVARGLDLASIDVDASGASDVTLAGTATRLSVELSGSSDLEATELLAQDVDIESSGASDAMVCATETVEADLSGASSLHYTCEPTSVQVEASGSSDAHSF